VLFDAGFHQYSTLYSLSDGFENYISLEEAADLPRLADGLHKMEFVGEGSHEE
jgi:hypothetical protein